MLDAHLIRDGCVKTQDVAEALDELQRWVCELARRSRFMRESVGAAPAVLFDSGNRLQDLVQDSSSNKTAFMYSGALFCFHVFLWYSATSELMGPAL